MLIEFNFKNFKSFKDDAVLDLSATKITEHSNHILISGKEKVLPVAAIYGANASGKSCVYDAFRYMSEYVVFSFRFGDDDDEYDSYRPTPFAFSAKSKAEESQFEVYFTQHNDFSGKVYNYGFCVDQYGVTEEWFNSRAKTAKEFKTVFYRNTIENELDLSGLPTSSKENIKVALDRKELIASLGSKLKISKCKIIRDWFMQNEFANFGNSFESYFKSRTMPKNFADDKAVQKKVVEYLASFDGQIQDFKVEKVPRQEDEKEDRYEIRTVHSMTDADGSSEIMFSEESAGTQKMFSLYPDLQDVMESGSVFWIDELNARLHPLPVRKFILFFLDPEINKKGAQLIFTTHDTSQLSRKLLRRDEIYFTNKSAEGISTLYSLADFKDDDGLKIRKDGDYEKNYLLGKYGAIPELRKFYFQEEM